MAGKTVILKISNETIDFSPEYKISVTNTNIPYKYLAFNEREEIYWEAEQISFNKTTNTLFLKIIDFKPEDISAFLQQSPKTTVSAIVFEKMKWYDLEPFLTNYSLAKIEHFIIFPEKQSVQQNKSTIHQNTEIKNYLNYSLDFTEITENLVNDPAPEQEKLQNKPELIKRIVQINDEISFNKLVFNLGYVEAEEFIVDLNRIVKLYIANDFILPEFNFIKNYFAKQLKIKKIAVFGEITLLGDEVTDMTIQSPEIARINESLIESVKYLYAGELLKHPLREMPDKSLFTNEDVFDAFDEQPDLGNKFIFDENELMTFLKGKASVRNQKQLEYLSGKLHNKAEKIRFTLRPDFGFLFLVEGEKRQHYIWELLDSHATYIWSFEKNPELKLQYRKIEDIIATIKTIGREKYKGSYQNHYFANDFIFNSIKHQNANSDFVDSFPQWRSRIDSLLV